LISQNLIGRGKKRPIEHNGNFIKPSLKALTYHCPMSRTAKVKNGFAPKVCVRCGLEFEWRKKWAKNWDEVKYCSDRCRENK